MVIFHIEAKKVRCGLQPDVTNFIKLLGPDSLYLFFVLSSFLLTYLLLVEAKTSGDISVKNFYVRRALKIWPLYLLIIGIVFFVVPIISPMLFHPAETAYIAKALPTYPTSFIMFLCMVPNLAHLILPQVICGVQCWSLGIEEQFYLFWPVLVKSLRKRPILMCTVFGAGLFITYFGVSFCRDIFSGSSSQADDALKILAMFGTDLVMNLRYMLIGAIAAVAFFLKKDLVARFLYTPFARVAILTLLVTCISGMRMPYPNLVCGMVFGLLVLTLTDENLKLLKSPLLVYLGTISYGLYMYHLLAINLVIGQAVKVSPEYVNIALYTAALPLTIVMSVVSYELFEKQFLRLKDKFSTVKSS